MATEARVYNATGDRTSDPATFSFWDPVLQKTFVLELDSTNPLIPVNAVVTVPPLQYTRNAVTTTVTRDTTTPASNRPLPVELLAGDSLGPVAVGIGTSNSSTMRVHVGNGSSIDVSVPGTVSVLLGDSSGNGVTSTLVGAKRSLDVNVAASALPAGAATETTLAAINTKFPAQGQALAVASTPVVLTAAQITTLTPQTNALTDTQLRATALPISGTVAVTGVATETTLAALNTKIPAQGQALAAASIPVVLTAAQITTLTPQTNALTDTQLRATAVPTRSGLGIPIHDALAYTSAATTDTYVYRTGGIAGSIVATVVMSYTDATKAVLTTVVRT